MSVTQLSALLTGPGVAGLPPVLLLHLGLALAISSIGFRRVVHFISIGYAFSIVAMALATTALYRAGWHPLVLAQQAVLVAWGLRLGLYLVRRELHPAYAAQLRATHERTAGMRLGVKLAIWVSVSLLYVAMYSPALFFAASDRSSAWSLGWGLAGAIVAASGLLLETVADAQKSAFKRRCPGDFCDTGLYRVVRCPNYLGEMLIWTGSFLCAVGAFTGPAPVVLSTVGLACILLIMMGSTKRLEREQEQRYGDREDYRRFVRTVPVLFPFVPVYTLKNVRVYLE